MPLNLVDGNNFARVQFEADPGGLPLRTLFIKAFHDPNPSVYVFDGKDAKARRRAVYPEYKMQRKRAPDNFYLMLGFYKELLMHTKAVMVEVPGYEGDDVIATLVRANPNLDIVIESTDADFCALSNQRVLVPKANLKSVGVEAKDVRLYKTLVKDVSDNIKGIKLFGDAAWSLLTRANKDYWEHRLETRSLGVADYNYLGLTRELHCNWLAQNHKLIQTYWDIVGFYDVPASLIAQHTTIGVPNYALAESKLSELMQ